MKQLTAIACILFACLTVNAQSPVVRLQSVIIPVDSGLLTDLLADFEKISGYHVQTGTTDQPYTLARQGAAAALRPRARGGTCSR